MYQPLSERMRPHDFDSICGQSHLLAKEAPFRRVLEQGIVQNMIFYGPPGVGKTTVAQIIAKQSAKRFHQLNATTASTADIKQIIAEIGTFGAQNGIVLYLDEIQYFNKKQQQNLLEWIEKGSITLIASTTENPAFYIYQALLSRCSVFEFHALTVQEIEHGLEQALLYLSKENEIQIEMTEQAKNMLARQCAGDMRKALRLLEFAVASLNIQTKAVLDEDLLAPILAMQPVQHDKADDLHYDCLSALQKSIRGSDANAAIYYLARILAGGDLLSACRRILVTASEDIGLAYPQAITIVKACTDAAVQLGMPEARIPLAQAVILLATAPKSNSSYRAINAAMKEVKQGGTYPVPRALQNQHYDGENACQKGQHYLYPHDSPNHWVSQQYLPDELKDAVYYEYATNKAEQAAKRYWDEIRR